MPGASFKAAIAFRLLLGLPAARLVTSFATDASAAARAGGSAGGAVGESVARGGAEGQRRPLARSEVLLEAQAPAGTDDPADAALLEASDALATDGARASAGAGAGEGLGGPDLSDISDAGYICGPPALVRTCGFESVDPICLQDDEGYEEDCYQGLCVCSEPSGACSDPVCAWSPDGYCTSTGPCREQGQCISYESDGWSCWHPCNWAHRPQDYGDNWQIVDKIRMAGLCDGVTDLDGDPDLDGGLELVAQSVFLQPSPTSAGGLSRRRATVSPSAKSGGGSAESKGEEGGEEELPAADSHQGHHGHH